MTNFILIMRMISVRTHTITSKKAYYHSRSESDFSDEDAIPLINVQTAFTTKVKEKRLKKAGSLKKRENTS